MFLVRARSKFSAAHRLTGSDPECGKVHGHTWRLELCCRAGQLDSQGFSFDFRTLRRITGEIARQLDHNFINDLPQFAGRNPTAEHIAQWAAREATRRLADWPAVEVESVTVGEADDYETVFLVRRG